jgi:hypothetical protein
VHTRETVIIPNGTFILLFVTIMPRPRLSQSMLATVSNQRPSLNNLEPGSMGEGSTGGHSVDAPFNMWLPDRTLPA